VAHGEKTSHSVPITSSASTTLAPSSSARLDARSASRSASKRVAPASCRWAARRLPTEPSPWIRMDRPSRSSLPNVLFAVARTPWNTPTAVAAPGSPEPPLAFDRPRTCGVRSPTVSISASPVFMSAAVT
jgi:hypothetical protein